MVDVLPLDNSTLARWNTPRRSLTAGRTAFTYSGELTGVPASAAPSSLGADRRGRSNDVFEAIGEEPCQAVSTCFPIVRKSAARAVDLLR